MAMLGPVWSDLREPTAQAMLQQLTRMLQVCLLPVQGSVWEWDAGQ